MAVVTKYSAGYKSPNLTALPKAEYAASRPQVISSKPLAVANGDSIGSKFYLGKVSSTFVPVYAGSTLIHTAITGLTSFKIGLERDGATVDDDLFSGALNLTSAGSKNPFAALDSTTLGKAVWELLGLSYDPGVYYDVVGVMAAAATADGTLSIQMMFGGRS